MIKVTGQEPSEQLAGQVFEIWFTEVVPEVLPLARELLQEFGKPDDDPWFVVALIIAMHHHPKMELVRANHRLPDTMETTTIKDVKLLARVARHLQPAGRGLMKALEIESIPKTSFYTARDRRPPLWEKLKGDPQLAEDFWRSIADISSQ
jgi:hypothetical protein